MKVLLVTPHYYPAIGGVEKYVHTVAAGLRERGDDVVVVTCRLPGMIAEEVIDDVKVIRVPYWFRVSNTPINPLWYFQLRQIIATFQPDVINIHAPVPGLPDAAFWARGRRRCVMTYHSGSMKKGSVVDPLIAWYERVWLRHIFRRADAVVSVYPAFVHRVLGPHQRAVTFIPPGIDSSYFVPASVPNNPNTILFVGRIEHTSNWKGIGTLLSAMQLVVASHPDARLRLVGGGDAVEHYQRLSRELGIEANVTCSGALRGDELRDAYQSASMLVLPSETDAESFGVVLIEAMSCGLPVIGSRIGGVPNVIIDTVTGLLTRPRDASSIAQAITTLLTDPDSRARLGAAGRARVVAAFSREQLITTTNELFDRVIRQKIVHITAFFPPSVGGMENAISYLADAQHQAGQNVCVVTSDVGKGPETVEHAEPYDVTRLRAWYVAHTPLMWGLLWCLLRYRRAIFHVHVAHALVPEIAWLAARLTGSKVVFHVHADVQASGKMGALLPAYKKYCMGFFLRRADWVIVPTPAYGELVQAKYDPAEARIDVIPSGINQLFFRPQLATTDSTRLHVLVVGRLTVEKNVDIVIKAAGLCDFPIVVGIVGDGPLRQPLQRLADETQAVHSNVRVEFFGEEPSDLVYQRYGWADVMAIASSYESQSLVAVEAMATGTLLVARDVPGLRDTIDGSGVLVTGDAASFATAFTALFSGTLDTAELVRKSQRRATDFSWNTIETHTAEVYSKL